MNIYEAIKTNFNEAYEVGHNKTQLINLSKQLINTMEIMANKYITKDVIQAIYKVRANDLDRMESYIVNSDGIHERAAFKMQIPTGDTVYLYGPVGIDNSKEKPEIFKTTYITIGAPITDVYNTVPSADKIFIGIDDGGVSFETAAKSISKEEEKEYFSKLSALLESKETLLKEYKDICKNIAYFAKADSDNIAAKRKEEVATKQREVANKLNF